MEVQSEISQTSRGTAGTAATSRALGLLESIKLATKPAENQEFIKILSLFKQKKISSSEAFERVSQVLGKYPKLLIEFKSYLPASSSGSNVNISASPTKQSRYKYNSDQLTSKEGETVDMVEESTQDPKIFHKPQFNNALAFVQKVKMTYQKDPQIYEKFLLLLKNYQRGMVSQLEVCSSVEALLSKTPGLAHEFRVYYGPSDYKNYYTTNPVIENISALPRADSNDTMISHAGLNPIPSFTQHHQPRTLSFASSAPMASIAATTITPDNYIESNEREPLLGHSLRGDVISQVESQVVDERYGKKYSPITKSLLYFSMFLILFIGALIAAAYFGYLDFSIN